MTQVSPLVAEVLAELDEVPAGASPVSTRASAVSIAFLPAYRCLRAAMAQILVGRPAHSRRARMAAGDTFPTVQEERDSETTSLDDRLCKPDDQSPRMRRCTARSWPSPGGSAGR
jgi:hypothetical protein